MDREVTGVVEDVQVTAKPKRRTYTAEYKRRILKRPTRARRRVPSAHCSDVRGCTRRTW